MAIRIIESGSLLDDPCRVLVCPVNCIPGVMGKGLAYDFAVRWPKLRDNHREACVPEGSEHALRPGKVSEACMIDMDGSGEIDRITHVLLAATKDHYRDPSRMPWVESCLGSLVRWACHTEWNASRKAIALPALGCGCGGLRWDGIGGVRSVIADVLTAPAVLRKLPDVEWRVYAPKE